MKHNIKITLILLAMFVITQFIGLAVIHAYSPVTKTLVNTTTGQLENITIKPSLPYGMQSPEEMRYCPPVTSFNDLLICLKSLLPLVISFTIAVFLVLLIMKKNLKLIMRLWFFFVVIIAMAITMNAAILKMAYSQYIALVIALPLAFFKIFKRNMLVHNLTELMIYPGIAAIFVPILNLWAIIILLILISVYDIYAVWHSGFMQKMAKFQINQLKIFAGFFVPYADKKTKMKIRLLKEKYKNKQIPEKVIKNHKIKVSLAILGGGDVVFPLVMAGVVLRTIGFGLIPALMISLFATLSLLVLFIAAKKGKFYPAMPFITAGCFAGLLVGYIIHMAI